MFIKSPLNSANWRSTIVTYLHTFVTMSSDVRILFAQKLKAIRQERNLSQLELALMCDVDRTYIGRIETLKRVPSLVILQKIADGLGMPLTQLVKFD